MEASTSEQPRCYSKPIPESHLDLLSRGTLSDVTFIVGPNKRRIPRHQVFLAARSPVFEVMFSQRWNQNDKKEIPLENVDPKIFKIFLQFIYADTIEANVPETLELFQVAHTYDVQLLVSKCEDILLANELTLNDAVDVFQAAQNYEKIQLMDKAGDLMAKSLPELQSHPSFARVAKETLMYLLKRNCLQMKEVDLFCLAVKWAKNQADLTTEQSLEDILPFIRFPTMTLKEFTRTVVPTGLLSQSTLVDVFTYFGADAETRYFDHFMRYGSQIFIADLYSGNLARKETKLLNLEELRDYLLISTRVASTNSMGISGISFYCPARVASKDSRPAGPTFKEFNIVLRDARRNIAGGPNHNILLAMSPVKAEEGKMTEIKFKTVVPLESFALYSITVEEVPPVGTQLEANEWNYYVCNVLAVCGTVNLP